VEGLLSADRHADKHRQDVRQDRALVQAPGGEKVMLASVITFLIYICILAIVIYLIIWVLTEVVGLPIPAKVIQLLWVIVALIAILWLVQMVLGGGGFHLPKF
jgi:hypothetical protein